ncbi:MAG: Crp/Fnr family transcriptional regulator [Cyclobacteriaceae bacterium]
MHPLHRHIENQVDLPDVDFNRLLDICDWVHFKKGSLLIQPGQPIHHQYFVIGGCLRAYAIDLKGKDHTIQFAIEDWWMSDYIAYYSEGTSQLHVSCIEDCELLKISKKELVQLFDTLPQLERFFRRQLENAFVAFQSRILTNLKSTAYERYELFLSKYPNIEQRVKNYHVASYLGITPESLSRLRKQRTRS